MLRPWPSCDSATKRKDLLVDLATRVHGPPSYLHGAYEWILFSSGGRCVRARASVRRRGGVRRECACVRAPRQPLLPAAALFRLFPSVSAARQLGLAPAHCVHCVHRVHWAHCRHRLTIRVFTTLKLPPLFTLLQSYINLENATVSSKEDTYILRM